MADRRSNKDVIDLTIDLTTDTVSASPMPATPATPTAARRPACSVIDEHFDLRRQNTVLFTTTVANYERQLQEAGNREKQLIQELTTLRAKFQSLHNNHEQCKLDWVAREVTWTSRCMGWEDLANKRKWDYVNLQQTLTLTTENWREEQRFRRALQLKYQTVNPNWETVNPNWIELLSSDTSDEED